MALYTEKFHAQFYIHLYVEKSHLIPWLLFPEL